MTDKQWLKLLERRIELRKPDIKIMVLYLLDHGRYGHLSNQNLDDSMGEMAYQAALRLSDLLQEEA